MQGEEHESDNKERNCLMSDGKCHHGTSENRVPSRSPHPYHRRSLHESTSRVKPDLASRSRQQLLTHRAGSLDGYEDHSKGQTRRYGDNPITSPSESGTEADDEGWRKALPAPPSRPRKGLKMGFATGIDGQVTPLLTPTALDDETSRFKFGAPKTRKPTLDRSSTDDELRAARAKFVSRRRAELTRRISEVVLMAVIGLLVLRDEQIKLATHNWHRELFSSATIILALHALYPLRLFALSWKRTRSWRSMQKAIRLPAAFDPAPLLYPTFIPLLVALVLSPTFPKILVPNLVLGIASVPAGLFRFGDYDIEPLRWIVSSIPLVLSEHTDIPNKAFAIVPYRLKLRPWECVQPEVVVSLYPLHHALVNFLHYLTTTSLLQAEVHLMSIGLINLLLCAEMPHAVILQILLWFGGLGVFILVGPIVRWNIALARVPRWRFRRAARIIQLRQSFLIYLNQALTRRQSVRQQRAVAESDADEDDKDTSESRAPTSSWELLKSKLFGLSKTTLFSSVAETPKSPAELKADIDYPSNQGTGRSNQARSRSNAVPTLGGLGTNSEEQNRKRRTYGKTLLGRSFLSLTQQEATLRRWFYASYVYIVMAFMILGPIRNAISYRALENHEPFGWAIGYLFGNLQQLRFFVWNNNLSYWIPLPPLAETFDTVLKQDLSRAEYLRQIVIGEANTRLILCAWCLIIIAVGLLVVLSFTFVEVDTRRKVFHGMMVAMLLPTIFIDPAFISLALAIILAIFLILDLLRASQLPPLSQPLAYFLTPYVDGRDLRGPVVVSHIFLLIGCAVPLWLSLAGMDFTGTSPWTDWEVAKRDTSMIAGVVCVGMGDAAASLIGRRYGRRKWPWTGGKSLEGSAAFAVAVTIGLVVGKLWLRLGQWDDLHDDEGEWAWLVMVFKALVAACGASFNEAVLTGGNDNVIVPVVLWLLVKALAV